MLSPKNSVKAFNKPFRKNATAKPLRAAAAPLAFKVYYKP